MSTQQTEIDAGQQAARDAYNEETATPPQALQEQPDEPDQSLPDAVQADSPPPMLAEITQDQYQDLLRRADMIDEIKADNAKKFDTAFGSLGGLKQSIERMQSERAQPGKPLEVSVDDFPELKEDYPELAEQIAKALPNILARVPVGGSMDDGKVSALIQQQTAHLQKELTDYKLNQVVGGDWVSVARSEEFNAWKGTWNDGHKKLFESSVPSDAAELLRAFVAHKQTAKPAAASTISTRQRQIQAAVPLKGTQSSSGERQKSETDYARDAYNS